MFFVQSSCLVPCLLASMVGGAGDVGGMAWLETLRFGGPPASACLFEVVVKRGGGGPQSGYNYSKVLIVR